MDRLEEIKKRVSIKEAPWGQASGQYAPSDTRWLISEVESLQRDKADIIKSYEPTVDLVVSLTKQLADYKAASESEDRWHKWAQEQMDDLARQLAAKDTDLCVAGETENAIRVLLKTHMHLNYWEELPIIIMGATPRDWDHQFYAQAWLLLWEKYGPNAKTLAQKE